MIMEVNVNNEEEFLESLETTLSKVENNIGKLILEEIPERIIDPGLDKGIERLETEEKKMRELLGFLSQSLSKVQRDSAEKLSALERKCEDLNAQLMNRTTELEKAREEIEQLKNQILRQSMFCASLGAMLGNLSWRASRFPQIVDVWLSGFQDKMQEFLSILNGSFDAFINTYEAIFPPTSNVEYQFIIGMLGIVTNISASPEGRQFLITNAHGKDFVRKTIKCMPGLPVSSGSLFLTRLMLMILYNVSMNASGLQHLLDSRVTTALSHCLSNDSLPEELHLLCLRVLQSISYDLTEPKYIQDLLSTLPISRLERLSTGAVGDLARQVVEQLQAYRSSLN